MRTESPSSFIKSIEHDEEKSHLTVVLRSGKAYTYGDVPADVYEEFAAAESHGKHYNQNIRPYYKTI